MRALSAPVAARAACTARRLALWSAMLSARVPSTRWSGLQQRRTSQRWHRIMPGGIGPMRGQRLVADVELAVARVVDRAVPDVAARQRIDFGVVGQPLGGRQAVVAG